MTDADLRRVVELLSAAPAGPAGNRLLCVDGFSGAGKTTVARALGGLLDAPVLALDEIYPGWDGLAAAPAIARDGIGDPLAAGTTLRWPTWDWDAGRPGPWREHPPAPVVVLEGCGAGAQVLEPVTALLVWVHADDDERERRLRHRADHATYAPFRDRWRAQELAFAAAEDTRARAGVVLATARRRGPGHPP